MGGQFTGANRVVAVVPETEAGVYNAPSPSDYDIEFYDAAALSFERNPVRLGKPAVGNLMQGRSKVGKVSATGYAVKCALKHSGDATQTPKLDKLFRSAGLWKRTAGVGGAIEYYYDGTQPCQTLSVDVTEFNCGRNPDAIVSKGRGAVSNMVINGSGIGELLDVTFELSMAHEAELDATNYTKVLTGQDGGQPEKLLGVVFTINDKAYCLHNFSLNMNNEVAEVADPSKSGGIYQYKVVGSDPTLTVSVQQLSLSESDFMHLLAQDLDTDAETVTIAGRAYDIVIDKANIRNLSIGDAGGINTNELEIEVRGFKLVLKNYVD
jgi:hypothetical protein